MKKLLVLVCAALLAASGAFADAWNSAQLTQNKMSIYSFVSTDTLALSNAVDASACPAVAVGWDPAGTGAGQLLACPSSASTSGQCVSIATLNANTPFSGFAATVGYPWIKVNRTALPAAGPSQVFVYCGKEVARTFFDVEPLRFMIVNLTAASAGTCFRVLTAAAGASCNTATALELVEFPIHAPPGAVVSLTGIVCTPTQGPATGNFEAPDYIRVGGLWRNFATVTAPVATTSFVTVNSTAPPQSPQPGEIFDGTFNEPSPFTGSQGFKLQIQATNDTGVAWTGTISLICTARIRTSA